MLDTKNFKAALKQKYESKDVRNVKSTVAKKSDKSKYYKQQEHVHKIVQDLIAEKAPKIAVDRAKKQLKSVNDKIRLLK